MSIEQIIVLAIVQGISEFLPISSSAHLALVPYLTNWQDQGLAVDILIHLGSLAAVLVYFRQDVTKMLVGLNALTQGKQNDEQNEYGRLALFILLATLPAIFVGAAMQYLAPHNPWRNVELIAWNSIIFAIILFLTDKFGKQHKTIKNLKINSALIIGTAQAIALMPGVSRSGITISAGRALGFTRQEAARFSFLLSIPAIFLAASFTTIQATQQTLVLPDGAIWVAVLSFFTAIMAIYILMTLIKHISFVIFVIYRLCLGGVLLFMLYG